MGVFSLLNLPVGLCFSLSQYRGLVAKVAIPKDLLDTHADIQRRVTWLETHSTNSPGESEKLTAHFHDIVEHLFRGSMQAHTGAAPFGHLAAHFWEREHDDPQTIDNWEFHRKMRLMRERIGANRPLVDMIGPGAFIWAYQGKTLTLSLGWTYFKAENAYTYRRQHLAEAPGAAGKYNVLARGSQVVQPVAFPGDPARQAREDLTGSGFVASYRWTEYKYYRPAGYSEGKLVSEQQGPFYSGNEPSEEDNLLTQSNAYAKQELIAVQHATDEAVPVVSPIGYAHGGLIIPRSKRWKEYGGTGTAFNNFPSAVTLPSSSLDGNAVGPYDAIFGGALPTDIFIWGSRQGQEVTELYNEATSPLDGTAVNTKTRLYVANKLSARSGVYGSMWYLMNYTVEAENKWTVYVPADFIQSPGPPTDYDNTQPLPSWKSGEGEEHDPDQPGGTNENNFAHGTFEDPEKPLRTFAEAITLFGAQIGKPEFNELVAFWARHLVDFNKRGSAFNHGWHGVYKPGAVPLGGHVEYLKRYRYMHWRGRLVTAVPSTEAGSNKEAWRIPETLPKPLDPVMNFTCNSNLGPVLIRLEERLGGTSLILPEFATIGPASASKLVYIDLDGVSYPYE